MNGTAQTKCTAHVIDERIQELGKGKLEYSPVEGMSGTVLLESVGFFLTRKNGNLLVLGRCDKNGNIVPTSEKLGVSGYVASNGEYKLISIKGIKLISDTILVCYDYEFDIPYMPNI